MSFFVLTIWLCGTERPTKSLFLGTSHSTRRTETRTSCWRWSQNSWGGWCSRQPPSTGTDRVVFIQIHCIYTLTLITQMRNSCICICSAFNNYLFLACKLTSIYIDIYSYSELIGKPLADNDSMSTKDRAMIIEHMCLRFLCYFLMNPHIRRMVGWLLDDLA